MNLHGAQKRHCYVVCSCVWRLPVGVLYHTAAAVESESEKLLWCRRGQLHAAQTILRRDLSADTVALSQTLAALVELVAELCASSNPRPQNEDHRRGGFLHNYHLFHR